MKAPRIGKQGQVKPTSTTRQRVERRLASGYQARRQSLTERRINLTGALRKAFVWTLIQ